MNVILALAGIYAVAGMFFALWFVSVGVERVDEAARGAGAGFRILIAPGAAALWPVLLAKYLTVGKHNS